MDQFWIVDDDAGEWRVARGKIAQKMEPGLYELSVSGGFPMGPTDVCLRRMKLATDKLLKLPGSLASHVLTVVETFWASEKNYRDMGLLHKRGILMEGPPGSGKSATCLLVGQGVGERGGVAIFVPSASRIGPLPEILKTLREMHPELPLVTIIEDIDRHRRENDVILPMLDGEVQVDNIVHIATTNHIAKLDETLIDRPSRFDEVIKARPPLKAEREAYIRSLFNADVEISNLEQIVEATKGLNYAHLKEVAISSFVYSRDPFKAAARVKAMAQKKGTGFGNEEDSEEG